MNNEYKKSLIKFFKKFPEINLDNIILQSLHLNDANEYFDLFNNKKVNNFLSDEVQIKNIEDAKSEIQYWGNLFNNKEGVYWKITNKKTMKMIGSIGYSNWNFYNCRIEVSYELMPQYWRKGIMSKALSATLNCIFQNMKINRVEARTMIHNTASKKLLEKFGFYHEGIIRDYRFIRSEFRNINLYSLLKKDYQNTLKY